MAFGCRARQLLGLEYGREIPTQLVSRALIMGNTDTVGLLIHQEQAGHRAPPYESFRMPVLGRLKRA